MKIERTKNASRNMIFGTIQKVYTLLVPFIIRTLMIYFMGVEYLGLNSLFTSILQVLNLTELGVGSAMVFSMYKPIAEDDNEKICQLMNLYKIYYRAIGGIIAVVGCILIPFIPYLISSDSLNSLPATINVYVLYVLNLGATVLTYLLFSYKNSLFNAFQRTDVTSKISLITITLQYGLQVLAICLFKNYYIYLIVALFTQALTNVITAIVANKMYPQFKAKGKLPIEEKKQINQRIKDLFTSKIGNIAVNSADTIVISAFLGLTVLAVYQNYFYIITSLAGIIQIIFTACTAGIGNSLIVETEEKNFKDFKTFLFILGWIIGFCTTCLLCLFQPFMKVWVGEEYMLSIVAVIFFCIYFFVQQFNTLLNTYKDAAGIWHQDRWRPLVVAGSNLILNLIFVQFWNIYGVLASTFLTTLAIGMPWLLHNLFATIFEKKHMKETILRIVYYAFVTIVCCAVTFISCYFINFSNDWVVLIVKAAVCIIVPNSILIIFLIRLPEFKNSLNLLNRITKNKIKPLMKLEHSIIDVRRDSTL